ncbi:hypothetical protein BaRGS_00035392 [Batillaria attramentaria]|uniref:Uncharacterized protein n=1 Tax=Batillaria attramentaria TaxID=370345 RepID=A0ABD0JEH5_9CAEN
MPPHKNLSKLNKYQHQNEEKTTTDYEEDIDRIGLISGGRTPVKEKRRHNHERLYKHSREGTFSRGAQNAIIVIVSCFIHGPFSRVQETPYLKWVLFHYTALSLQRAKPITS